jgi:hypothetical protein
LLNQKNLNIKKMARLVNGVFGGISGKAGDFEGFIRNGIAYVRARRRKTTKAPTEKVLANRRNMAIVTDFLTTMTPFVRVGFSLKAHGQTFSAFDAAKSYHMLHALEGDYPNASIRYSAVLLCEGNMPKPLNPVVSPLPDGLQFSWDPSSGLNSYEQIAQTMLLVHSPDLNKSFYRIGGAGRLEGQDKLILPEESRGLQLQAYMAFVGFDRLRISNSVYLGEAGWF